MAFNIKIPFVISTHLRRLASDPSSGARNKSKAGGMYQLTSAGFPVKYDENGTLRTVVNLDGTQTLTNKTLTAPTLTSPVVNTPVITDSVNASGAGTVQLTTAQSGGVFLFDAATGIVYTLPPAAVGLTYTFLVTVTVTSNSHKVITKNATELLIGSLVLGAGDNVTPGAAPGPKFFSGNGTTHIAVTQNSASSNATGGIIGSWIIFTCLSATQWFVQGNIECGSGATIATPFATS